MLKSAILVGMVASTMGFVSLVEEAGLQKHVETIDGAEHEGMGGMSIFKEKDGVMVNPGASDKCWSAVQQMLFENRKNTNCQAIMYKTEGIHANEQVRQWHHRHEHNGGWGLSKEYSHHIKRNSPLEDCHCAKVAKHGYQKALWHCTAEEDAAVHAELDSVQAHMIPEWCVNLKV